MNHVTQMPRIRTAMEQRILGSPVGWQHDQDAPVFLLITPGRFLPPILRALLEERRSIKNCRQSAKRYFKD